MPRDTPLTMAEPDSTVTDSVETESRGEDGHDVALHREENDLTGTNGSSLI